MSGTIRYERQPHQRAGKQQRDDDAAGQRNDHVKMEGNTIDTHPGYRDRGGAECCRSHDPHQAAELPPMLRIGATRGDRRRY